MIDPSDGQPFAAIASGTAEDIDRAVRAAEQARDGAWGRLAPAEKGRLLGAARARRSSITPTSSRCIEARDCGKPMKQARADVAACARYFEFYGGASDKLSGDTIPVSRRVHGADLARAARGHRPHHSVELSAADLRPLRRRSAGRRQRLRREAGRGRLPVAAARRRAGRGHRLAGRRAQHRHRTRARGRRRARHASRHRAPVVHRLAARRAPGSPAKPRSGTARSRWSWAARDRRSSSPTPISTRRCRRSSTPSCRTPARPARRAAACSSSARATRRCWKGSARASRRSRSVRRSPISIADR